MARINLLPWREEARKERQRQFLYSLMGTLVLGAILVLIVGLFFDQRISYQEARNQQIQIEINRLQQRINRIAELEKPATGCFRANRSLNPCKPAVL